MHLGNMFSNLVGVYQCRKCKCLICKHVPHDLKSFQGNDRTFAITSFIKLLLSVCGILFNMPYGLLYVGRMIRTLSAWFRKHRRFVEDGNVKYSIPRHFTEFHGKSFNELHVSVIESISSKLPVAEWFKRLCERENILDLQLNISISRRSERGNRE